MQQPSSILIQIAMGNDIVKLVTRPDQRTLLGKMLGQKAPDPGQPLLDFTDRLRTYLAQTHQLFLPPIQFLDNPTFVGDEVQIQIGLEVNKFKVQNAVDIFNYLIHRVRDYNTIAGDRNSLQTLLLSCLDDIKNEQYSPAYEKYLKIYYHATLQGFIAEQIQSLSEISCLFWRNGHWSLAATWLLQAAAMSRNPSFVDVPLKIQVLLNTAAVLRMINRFDEAANYYGMVVYIAQAAGNASYLLAAVTGIGEARYWQGRYQQAIIALELASRLVLSQPQPDRFAVAYQLQVSINVILRQIQQQAMTQQAAPQPTLFTKLQELVLNVLTQTLVGAVVYKLFKGSGMVSLFSFGATANYHVPNAIFNGPAIFGDRGIQHISYKP